MGKLTNQHKFEPFEVFHRKGHDTVVRLRCSGCGKIIDHGALRVFENGKMYVGELMCPPKDNWRVGSKCPPRKKKKLPTESAPDSAGPGPSSG